MDANTALLLASGFFGANGASESDVVLLAYGQYTLAETGPDMYIPVSYNGRPSLAYVCRDGELDQSSQAMAWYIPIIPAPADGIINTTYFPQGSLALGARWAGTVAMRGTPFTPTELTTDTIHVRRVDSSSYDPHAGTYNWYIWGYGS